MNESQLIEIIKAELSEVKSELTRVSARIQHLESEISFLKGKSEGFAKFKDTIYVGYMVVMTGIAVYAMFIK